MELPIRVLLADDSGFMRLLVSDILKSDKEIEVIATASNGREATEKTILYKPDVVVMDINMGEYNGLYGIEKIMEAQPTPIVILSSVGNNDFPVIERGLRLGAIDYLNKPAQNNTKVKEVENELIQKIKAAAVANIGVRQIINEVKINNNSHTFTNLNFDVVVIGASTGGPGAIESIIKKLPENMAVPILIAQHMPSNFVPSFASRLNDLSPLTISMARKGDYLLPGSIMIAPGSRNTMVKKDSNGEVYIDFSTKTFKEFNYPSIDCLMLSVAEVYGSRAIGVILTGMGRDGAVGMKAIKDVGGYTIAQDKDTCVVYGMPKEVVENGSAKAIVPISEIGGFIVSSLS
ncbi:MAG TPA: chemotaxis-specific protein-glutamate methyltransferase CheB [Cytophagaceae bacterium]|jgi:two-component system chemotaxis response regulator CheB|nr:chemotaxis-specific protein-glutamate methyltransferase CheB [Cytophagaceae bacterium]